MRSNASNTYVWSYERIITCLFAFLVRLLLPRPKRSEGILFGPDEACVDPSEFENGVVEVEVPFDSPVKRSRALKLTTWTFNPHVPLAEKVHHFLEELSQFLISISRSGIVGGGGIFNGGSGDLIAGWGWVWGCVFSTKDLQQNGVQTMNKNEKWTWYKTDKTGTYSKI